MEGKAGLVAAAVLALGMCLGPPAALWAAGAMGSVSATSLPAVAPGPGSGPGAETGPAAGQALSSAAAAPVSAPVPVAASKAGPEALAPAAAVQEAAPGAEALFDPAAAGSRAWRLSLPGKDPLILRSLSPGAAAPKFGVKDALVYAGMTVIWRASEKADANTSFLLALSSPAGAQGRLLLDDDFLYLDGRRLRLPSAMALQKGAPVLDARGLSAVIAALGAFQPRWDAAGAAELAAAAQAAGTPQPGAPGGEASPSVASAPAQTPEGAPSPSSEPTAHVAARPLKGGKVRTIVIDAGHGGYDPGARGPYGTKEKDVCLRIAERLRDALNDKDPDLRVVLTRDSDTFVSLEDRTLIANQARGDLFVSIHNNASPSPRTHGTQVFFFDSQSSDKAAEDLTMRENGEANQLDVLMTDLAKSIVRDQSIQFATGIQNALGETLNLKHRDISYAPFYVLARTQMPAILVEVAFITNPREELLLRNGEFQGRVANSLADGVVQYAHLSESPR